MECFEQICKILELNVLYFLLIEIQRDPTYTVHEADQDVAQSVFARERMMSTLAKTAIVDYYRLSFADQEKDTSIFC